jgi:hypothetical protein
MNRVLRSVALAGFLLGLPGCNMVVSSEPWFTEGEAEPVPVLRDGLWVSADGDCRFDEAKPAEQWPDCASASFRRGEEQWAMRWDDVLERGGRRRTFAGWEIDGPNLDGVFIANGDHLITQIETRDESGEAAVEPGGHAYLYAAIRLLRHDEAGRVTALESWGVQCGPLPEPAPDRGSGPRSRRGEDPGLTKGNVTDRPFPGLTVVEDNCVAESADAVRSAAVLSEALRPPARTRWIREGWR